MQSTITSNQNPARLAFFSKGKTIVSIFLSKRTLCLTVLWKSFLRCPVVRCVRVWERLCVFSHFPSLSCRLWSNNRGVGKWCVSRAGAAASKGTPESRVEVGDVDNGRFRVPRTWSLKHFHFPFTFSPPCCSRCFARKRSVTRKGDVWGVGEGSGNTKCINTFNMHSCRVRRAAQTGNRSVNISQRMLQHAVTHRIPNDSSVSYASSNKSFSCLTSITTHVPTYTLLERCCTFRPVFDIRNKVIML